METSLITTQGRMTIPIRIRRKYLMKKGTKLVFIEQNGKLMMQPLDREYFLRMAGILGTDGKMLRLLMQDKRRERESK